ncbi:hypothetical protein CPLU01_07074 [Colletotrichum plurivorum]|uniref:Uncharacterized protein n=1 Tax=Colletotrichum plurivorum TaxID=2175906 RepID=A0A8H6NFN6_9PEZI|nr:hypothetical protein CPLU01_07074 [Colletotrichum plurivorum]
MSRQNLTAPLLGAAAVLGGGIYYMRKPSSTSGDAAQQITNENKHRPTSDEMVANKKQQADAKRDLGLGGAGVGNNYMTGGTELGSGKKADNPNRDVPKGPKEKFPSDAGAIGGGPGRGNANSRAIETHGPSSGGGSSGGGISSTLQGIFGTGGSKEGDRPSRPVDTKIASHHADTPTNRGGSPWDKHRKDVTSVTPTES